MTQYLPPNLLALFAPRDPLNYLPPLDRPQHYRTLPYTGVAQFLGEFEDPKDTPVVAKVESRDERRERRNKERQEQAAYKLEQDLAMWDPHDNPNATSDPFNTLFVARIDYDTTEAKLRREFETYGPIRTVRIVHDKRNGRPRGYAFIEYEHDRDMHTAYKHAEGKKIDGRRVLVDAERARTIKNWRPRRLVQ
uniref:U1 small nuclear ribonucleoprotein 70 kDa n=1 Tax=Macrostomum lignano TaxID=282301 RepID=A0A1I8IJB1_9PLAT